MIGNFYVAPEPVKQYMVYGEAAIANGEDWNENSDINVMTTTDEGLTYTLTIEGVQLQAFPRLYEFKIIEKGNNQMEYYPVNMVQTQASTWMRVVSIPSLIPTLLQRRIVL